MKYIYSKRYRRKYRKIIKEETLAGILLLGIY